MKYVYTFEFYDDNQYITFFSSEALIAYVCNCNILIGQIPVCTTYDSIKFCASE